MADTQTANRIAEAWNLHRSGDNNGAIDIYSNILKAAPTEVDKNAMSDSDVVSEVRDTIDAYYGMGLAQRDSGNEEDAINAFQKALTMADDALEGLGISAEEEGQNDLQSIDDDRFLMLHRMISQRLDDLGVDIDTSRR